MLQNIIRHLGGVQDFGIISLCLFCAVFVGVLFWAFLQKKNHLEYMSRVALDPESDQNQTGERSHE
jgi:hypothetical protein